MKHHPFYFERLSVREYPKSVNRNKPLACTFHNPILRRKGESKDYQSSSPKNLSMKVLDLQLPTIALPKILQRCLFHSGKPMHYTKRPPRSISILPDLYVGSLSHSP